MKKLSILIFSLFCLGIGTMEGQYFIAGRHAVNNCYAAPNATIYAFGTYPNSGFATYNIDINGDGINDFQIQASGGWVNPNTEYNNVTINALNGNQVSEGLVNPCAWGDTMASALQLDDTINSKSFKSYNNQLFLGYLFSNVPLGSCAANFDGPGEFIGVRIFKAPDTLYGWIRVAGVQSDGCTIVDYACSGIVNVIKGDTNNGQFKLYPNPSNGVFTIVSSVDTGQSSVEVYNVLGQKVYSTPLNLPQGGDFKIDLSSASSGMYFYRLLTENGNIVASGKLIKE